MEEITNNIENQYNQYSKKNKIDNSTTKSIEDEDFGDGDEIEGLIETF